MRQYVGASNNGVGEAEFLDELIPVSGWATDGNTRVRDGPETGAGGRGVDNPGSSERPGWGSLSAKHARTRLKMLARAVLIASRQGSSLAQ